MLTCKPTSSPERNRSFKTEAYLRPCQTPMMEHFVKKLSTQQVNTLS